MGNFNLSPAGCATARRTDSVEFASFVGYAVRVWFGFPRNMLIARRS